MEFKLFYYTLDLQQLIKRKYKSKVDLDLEEFVLNEIDILFDDIFENKEVNDEVRSNCENNNEKFIPNSIEDILKSVDKSISLEAEELFGEFLEISNFQNENIQNLLDKVFNSTQ
ncbi:hypothetical protein ABK040_007452 [Willaertia magna]